MPGTDTQSSFKMPSAKKYLRWPLLGAFCLLTKVITYQYGKWSGCGQSSNGNDKARLDEGK